MPHYCLQVSMPSECPPCPHKPGKESLNWVRPTEEQELKYFREIGDLFVKELCNHIPNSSIAQVSCFGSGETVTGRISIKTSCNIPEDVWLKCTGPLYLDKNIRDAAINNQLTSATGEPDGIPRGGWRTLMQRSEPNPNYNPNPWLSQVPRSPLYV